jgi:hypothetical protein
MNLKYNNLTDNNIFYSSSDDNEVRLQNESSIHQSDDNDELNDSYGSIMTNAEVPTSVAHSAQSDVLRAFNITSETHRNNNYSRTIDYTGCKTVLITMNRGAIMSDSLTNYRFQELHKSNPAT